MSVRYTNIFRPTFPTLTSGSADEEGESTGNAIIGGLLNLGAGVLQNLGTTAATAGGLAAIENAYDRLGNIGDAYQQGALEIAELGRDDAQFKPFSVRVGSNSPTTSQMFSSRANVDAQGGVFTDLSEAEQLLKNSLLTDAQQRVAANLVFDDELETTGRNILNRANLMADNIAVGPRSEREASLFNTLRAIQAPEEERQRLALEERLFNQGRLGVRTAMFGGTPEQLALAKAQEEAKNTAALMAIQQAEQERLNQARLTSDMYGLGTQLLGANLALQGQEQGLGLKSLEAAYRPETQVLANLRQGLLASQIAQRGQLFGTGLFGEASMGGLEGLLQSGIGQANLIGTVGTGLLAGALSPRPEGSTGGLVSILNSIGNEIFDFF